MLFRDAKKQEGKFLNKEFEWFLTACLKCFICRGQTFEKSLALTLWAQKSDRSVKTLLPHDDTLGSFCEPTGKPHSNSLESNAEEGLGYVHQVLFCLKLGDAERAIGKTIALKIPILNSLLLGGGDLKKVGKHLSI